MKKLTYEERLMNYERDKRLLREKNLSETEYLRAIKAIADKWGI